MLTVDAPAGPTVRLLGPLEVSVGGRPIRTTGRLRTMLAVLAMSAGETVLVDHLVTELWDDGQPAHARRAVQTYVARLRACWVAGRSGRPRPAMRSRLSLTRWMLCGSSSC